MTAVLVQKDSEEEVVILQVVVVTEVLIVVNLQAKLANQQVVVANLQMISGEVLGDGVCVCDALVQICCGWLQGFRRRD